MRVLIGSIVFIGVFSYGIVNYLSYESCETRIHQEYIKTMKTIETTCNKKYSCTEKEINNFTETVSDCI